VVASWRLKGVTTLAPPPYLQSGTICPRNGGEWWKVIFNCNLSACESKAGRHYPCETWAHTKQNRWYISSAYIREQILVVGQPATPWSVLPSAEALTRVHQRILKGWKSTNRTSISGWKLYPVSSCGCRMCGWKFIAEYGWIWKRWVHLEKCSSRPAGRFYFQEIVTPGDSYFSEQPS